MISADTPPGTVVIAVWDTDRLDDFLELTKPQYRGIFAMIWDQQIASATMLTLGARYTVAAIEPDKTPICDYLVRVVEIDGLYHPKCFDRAVLPSSLTSLLTRLPQPEDA